MRISDHPLYKADILHICSLDLPFELLKDSSVVVSGATGLIGSCLVDSLMALNGRLGLGCKVIALGRSAAKAAERFAPYSGSPLFEFVSHDINQPLELASAGEGGYVIHLASNTHPVAYATEPVSTITTNIFGTRNMLEFARAHSARRFAFASSNEVYGENRGDVELFDEKYCGYIDPNTLRAGYPESKRCGEALCQAYARQYGLDVVIPRFTRSFGPTLLASDTKALSQFLRNAMNGEDIVLKSAGTQFYSYTYVADAVAGFLYVLLKGESGGAYNIADESCDITLRDLAGTIAELCGTKVRFEIPDAVESAGFSKATKARLDASKLKALGWSAAYTMDSALSRTLEVLKTL